VPVYTVPNFNVFCDMWAPPTTPAANPPSFAAVQCQVYVFSRTPQLMFHPGSGRWLPVIIVRIPFAFAVTLGPDWIVAVAGSFAQGTSYVKSQYLQLMHAGFPNRYYAMYCLQCNANGTIPKTPLPT